MSQENVEIVRKAFEAWDAGGDLSGSLALLHDDLVVRRLAPMPDPGTWHGPEGLLEVAAEWMEAFDDFSIRAEEYIDADDYVVVRTAQGGRGTGGGVPVIGMVSFVYSFRDRKVITLDIYATRRQALEAAGLRE